MVDLIDKNGYRANVGIVLMNQQKELFFAKRRYQSGWQFPQGGIDKGETPVEAALRETKEEVGLDEHDIEIVYESQQWFRYKVPKEKRTGYFTKKIFFGQKQKWFLARLLSDENKIDLNAYRPIEFDKWVWANYWHPINAVVSFKKETYRQALLSILPEYNKLTKKL